MRSIMTSHKKSSSKSRCKKDKRRPWVTKEDDTMRRLVEENGTKQWTVIAEKLNKVFPGSRTGKQCRERWHNHLNPGINKKTWSLQEEITLFSTHTQLGNKWAEISNYLPGRTDNCIKNHFYSTLRKQYRSVKGTDGSRDQLKKHLNSLCDSILTGLRKKWKREEEEEFECSECEFMICGQQIDLPPPISPIYIEEAPMEFMWMEMGDLFPDEVFLMPLNTNQTEFNV